MTLKGLTLIAVEYLMCDHTDEGYIRLIFEDENKGVHIKTQVVCPTCSKYSAHRSH